MRILLQTPQGSGVRPRFCLLSVQKDLIEGWTLTRETGYQGYGGQLKRSCYSTLDGAVDAMVKVRDDYVRRGYRTVFSEGHAPPDN